MGQRIVEDGPQHNQSSVLFSLEELMGLEATRVEEERRAAALEASMQEDARRNAEAERRRLAEEAEAREATEREEEARRSREEAARHEAFRVAAVERARIEALGSARVEEQRLANDHQARLLELERDAEKKKLRRNIVVLALSSVLLVGSGLGFYFAKVRPDALAEQQRMEHEARNQAAEVARLQGRNADAQAQIEAIERERADIKLPSPPTPLTTVTSKPTFVRPPPPPPTATPICTDDHDPLNPCLTRR